MDEKTIIPSINVRFQFLYFDNDRKMKTLKKTKTSFNIEDIFPRRLEIDNRLYDYYLNLFYSMVEDKYKEFLFNSFELVLQREDLGEKYRPKIEKTFQTLKEADDLDYILYTHFWYKRAIQHFGYAFPINQFSNQGWGVWVKLLDSFGYEDKTIQSKITKKIRFRSNLIEM